MEIIFHKKSGWKFQKYLSYHHPDKCFVLQLVLNRSAVASKTLAIEEDLIDVWMSQEVSKWLVNGLQPTYKWGILGGIIHLLTFY